MAKTQIADIIVPELFEGYVVERTAEKSRLFQSGLIMPDPSLTAKIVEGGSTVNIPFFQDLQGDDQVLSDSGALDTKKITASSDVGIINLRGDAFSVNDLSRKLSGDDPLAAIIDLFADYWSRKHQAQLISTLTGVFSIASMAGNTLDLHHTSGGGGSTTPANILDGVAVLAAKQLLGDSKTALTSIAMHSAVETKLSQLDLIDFIKPSEGAPTISVFQGMEVIVDDGLPVETIDGDLVYSTYLFGNGAFAYAPGDGSEPAEGGEGTWAVEMAREALASDSYVINRKRFILHPKGVKWLGASMAGDAPTNAELETTANWLRVYEQKNVRMVRVRHNI